MASPKFTQAAHTLVIIDDQKPSDDDILKLHDGYLSDLVKAIKMRTIPPREGFQRAIGLLPDEIDESEANIYLRRIFAEQTVKLVATVGGIVNERLVRMTFSGDIDSRLLTWKSKPMPPTNVEIHDMIADATYAELFPSLAADLNLLRWQWVQVLEFCDEHRDKLRAGGYSTFFLITTDGEPVAKDLSNVFVARVALGDNGQPEAYVNPFSHRIVWSAGNHHPLVSPQFAAYYLR